MRIITAILLIFMSLSAYLPKNDMFNLLKGAWKLDKIGGGFTGSPPAPVTCNSKISFLDLTASDSIRYSSYLNDSLLFTRSTPLTLRKSIFGDTLWTITVIFAISDTGIFSFTTYIQTLSDTSLGLAQAAYDGLGFGFTRSSAGVEAFSFRPGDAFNVYPVPVSPGTALKVRSDGPVLSAALINPLGKPFPAVVTKEGPGFVIRPPRVPPGAYVIRLETPSGVRARKAMVVR